MPAAGRLVLVKHKGYSAGDVKAARSPLQVSSMFPKTVRFSERLCRKWRAVFKGLIYVEASK